MQHKKIWVNAISGAANVIQYPTKSRIMLHVHNIQQSSRKMHKISMELGYKTECVLQLQYMGHYFPLIGMKTSDIIDV
jgi:hypothetical protein